MKSQKSPLQRQYTPLLGVLLAISQAPCLPDPAVVNAHSAVDSTSSPQPIKGSNQQGSPNFQAGLKSDKGSTLTKQSKNPPMKTLVPDKVTASNAGTVSAKKTGSQTSASRKHVGNKDLFVPPPPPMQPSLLITPEFEGMPFLSGVMSKDELLSKSKEMTQQIKDLQEVLKEKQDQVQEAKEKAQRFKPLFEEGVVSRHELEATEKDALDAERDLERATRRASEIQGQEQILKDRLNQLGTRSSSNLRGTKVKKSK